MKICDKCPKNWDCEEPCLEAIAWVELGEKDRKAHKDYEPKGIPVFTEADATTRREKARRGGLSR